MKGFTHASRKLSLSRGGQDEGRGDSEDAEETVVDPDQGSIVAHLVSQLKLGADLSRVTLPTFILEPRSMLERITNFMCHPELILQTPEIEDPVQRFVAVIRHYMSGWHIKPPGVKKPLNPILGETYACYWDYSDNTKGYYFAEQTSHHPPKSSYCFLAPEHHIRIDGTLVPRSKFLGNSAASMMEGVAVMSFLNRGNRPGGEQYIVTQPNMYVRGILMGRLKFELGDQALVRCPDTGLSADIEFKMKGWWSGGYNGVVGTIKNDKTGETLYSLEGLWTREIFIKDHKTGKRELLFDATNAKPSPPMARPVQEQTERESMKLWYNVTQALKDRNQELATAEKTKVEDMQRQEAAQRQEQGREWMPSLFRPVQPTAGGIDERLKEVGWVLKAPINGSTPAEMVQQILQVAPILPEAEQRRLQGGQGSNNAAQPMQHSMPQQASMAPGMNNALPAQNQSAPPNQTGPQQVGAIPGQSLPQVPPQSQNQQPLVRERSEGQGADAFVDAKEA